MQEGAGLPVTLCIVNTSLFLNITPDTTPGVEVTRVTYLLSGDVVATADLAIPGSWQQLEPSLADWAAVPRLDAPVVIAAGEGTGRPVPKPHIIGVNSTNAVQQCVPTRVTAV